MARVAVDLPLPHLDRPFDYLVEDSQDTDAQPGCRVRVRFAGQLVDGFILERVDDSEHEGRFAFLERVVSAEPVLAPEIAELARAVADRWAGSLADILRLAIPPRHAAAERRPPTDGPAAAGPARSATSALDEYDGGAAFLREVSSGGAPRGVLAAVPGDWPGAIAGAAATAVAAGRGAVIVVPDRRDVARVDAALTDVLGSGRHVMLTADLGPAERYRRFLGLRRGDVDVVVGTRAAIWAPVRNLGLVVVWDDGDDLHAEPRAPYCHARDVAAMRSHLSRAGLLIAGHLVTAEGAALVESGWARALDPSPRARHDCMPSVRAAGDEAADQDPVARMARLPSVAWKTARDALAAGGPVLVQVPRAGYQPALACDACRQPARCEACAGPLGRGDDRAPVSCRWCGSSAGDWRCPACGATSFRASVTGARRTAEELGRAFPGVPVRFSGGDAVLDHVPAGAQLVVATPGAEPVADQGYGAALLLDGWAMLTRPDLRAGEETLRRWLNAAALVRPAAAGGRVVVVAPSELRPVQALVRWQPRWHAERELAERHELHLPPVARIAALTGRAAAVQDVFAALDLPAGAEVLGPVPVEFREGGEDNVERLLVRVPRPAGAALAAGLKQIASGRSARKEPDLVRIELDPVQLG